MTRTAPVAHRPGNDLPAASLGSASLAALVDDLLGGSLTAIFQRNAWAEDEIVRARRRYPEFSDQLYHSFSLLIPTHERMATEFVYRSHCRDLLDRIATGEDTRPATAAEIWCAMRQVSLRAPLRSSAAGLYMRMWQAAGFPETPELTEASRHHEALEASSIDENEQFARRKLAVLNRRLGAIDCTGRHHGVIVDCVYAAATG